jgi:hypothetical protein
MALDTMLVQKNLLKDLEIVIFDSEELMDSLNSKVSKMRKMLKKNYKEKILEA